ncbi:MAG TPA: serine/threonine-protein kinase [Candidatus Acidoferrum sp.]|nr:serine/threonine-protein kinase [Candidatus Acidoferrum sp.]
MNPEQLPSNPDPEGQNEQETAARADGEGTLSTDAVEGSAVAEANVPPFIGPYRLLRKLGEGGMGQVWLARQTAPVKRLVALKFIRGGMYDTSVIHRFESERQALAIMEHPAIAKVLDAGSTPDGQPYFVMEYVDGPSITRYCDTKKLKIPDRLQLFIKVCEGVQHAHQKAIIHRDLKPSNVLVTELDGKPVPRIIDFGIAKAITPENGVEQTMITKFGAMLGTPGFMSPEQVDPNVLDVDTRTDVYSLGVILYVLITGYLPLDPDQWKKKPFDEALRELRESDPPSPSTKVGSEKDTSSVHAENRATEPAQLINLLRGDLDWIVMKALEKDRARRYGTPGELAADIERYLSDQPVLARPASTGYRLRKYVRRHRIGVGVAAGLVLLLAGFSVVQAFQVRRISRERDRAGRITDFMTSMFRISDPSESRGNSVTAREILDKASKNINSGLAQDPELQAQMMHVMGNVYLNLGLYRQAEALFEPALATRRRLLGSKNLDTLESMADLAWVYESEGRFAEGEKLQRETLDILQRTQGPDNVHTLSLMGNLAASLTDQKHYDQAEKIQTELLERERRVLGPEHKNTLNTMNNLSRTYFKEGRYAEAEKMLREVLAVRQRVSGPDAPETLIVTYNITVALAHEHRYPEADALLDEVIQNERRVLGPSHPQTLKSMVALAGNFLDEGRYAEAAKLQGEVLDLRRQALGPDDPATAGDIYNLACVAARGGNRDEALARLREAVDHGLPAASDVGLEKDSDLNSLHGDPRFATLVAYAKKRAAEMQKPK